MAPASQKGTGKKGGPGLNRQRSRNSTPTAAAPTLPPTEPLGPKYPLIADDIDYDVQLFTRELTYEDIVSPVATNVLVPDSRALDGITQRLEALGGIFTNRGRFCDRGMRIFASTRNERFKEAQEDELRQANEEERSRRPNKKKKKQSDALASQDTIAGMRAPLFLAASPFIFASAVLATQRWRVSYEDWSLYQPAVLPSLSVSGSLCIRPRIYQFLLQTPLSHHLSRSHQPHR